MRRILVFAAVATLLALSAANAHAACPDGSLLITPHGSYYPLPTMLSSPATFSIVATDSITANAPNIVLVMTNASYQGLTGNVVVGWTGKSGEVNESIFPKSSFQAISTGYIPDPMVTPFDSGRYNVSDLKEHLGVNGTSDDTLYFTYGLFLGGHSITQTPVTFNVTASSTNLRMLVLAIAMTSCSPTYNLRVPPCRPGFVVPEPATVFIATSLIAALAFYSIKRRKST
jgi:hypothetical protein